MSHIACVFCGFQATPTASLEIHIRAHLGERPIFCSLCPKSFRTRRSLSNHFDFEHRRIPEALDNLYHCLPCATFFLSRSGLLSHVNEVHETIENITTNVYNSGRRRELNHQLTVQAQEEVNNQAQEVINRQRTQEERLIIVKDLRR